MQIGLLEVCPNAAFRRSVPGYPNRPFFAASVAMSTAA